MICGGMDSLQNVTERTFLLENASLSPKEEFDTALKAQYHSDCVQVNSKSEEKGSLYSLDGKLIKTFEQNKNFKILKNNHPTGT